jgi:hypothetical protein
MRTLYRFVRYMVIRSLVLSAIGWGIAWYMTGDQLRSPTSLREQSLSALTDVARAMGR